MFSRTTPPYDGAGPQHDPLPLRIVTAVVVLGLIATGVTVIWRDMAGHGGELMPLAASQGGLRQSAAPGSPGSARSSPARSSPARPSARRVAAAGTTAVAGLRLLSEAASACRQVSYQGVQLTAWQGPDGSWTSVVNVWHQRDHQTLIQAATLPTAALPQYRTRTADPDGDDDADQRDPESIMTMTSQMVALLAENYQVSLGGHGQVAGRPAQELVVRHRDGRLAARFWLDTATKLPLRRETFDGSAQMVSQDVFVSLSLGSPAAAAAPRTASVPGGKLLASVQLARMRAAGWPLPAQLPGQLRLVRARQTSGPAGTVVGLAYSDGLSVISLFVQRGHLPAQLNGWSQVALRGDRVYVAGPDQRSVAWSARGFVYTLIADAPDQTLDQVVGVLPHNAGPGFLGRMGRGLSRLVSWLDPFR
ncbi:MAG: sigma-E factor regulatory protein RseB domain-containing protein [Streptosporangiaceae bacterium]